jgi:two-component system response regulator AtoC
VEETIEPLCERVLVVDDEPNMRKVLGAMLRRDGYDVLTAGDGVEALEVVAEHHVDAVITDLRMPRLDGVGLLRRLQGDHATLPVIVLTAHGTVESAVLALKIGAFDFVTKPFDRTEMTNVVAKALRTHALGPGDVLAEDAQSGRFQIIGQSPAMREIYSIIDKVAATPSTVLITGESGTGKELIAQALHDQSDRRDRALIKVNCAAIPGTLIESELFGYEKGAFTGATTSKPGRFELADGGTLFLDEVGEIPGEMQVKLLRALQNGEFERVGGIKTMKVDVRLVAATNRDLRHAIEVGQFREDLFYRLNVVQVHLPPLRERRSDIPLLTDHFVGKFNVRLARSVRGIDSEARDRLGAYDWPGNIRELENVVERCILFCDGDTITVPDLPGEVRNGQAPDQPALAEGETSLKAHVRAAAERVERELILRALDQTGGNVTHSARLLKISRKSLQNKMKEFGLRDRDD